MKIATTIFERRRRAVGALDGAVQVVNTPDVCFNMATLCTYVPADVTGKGPVARKMSNGSIVVLFPDVCVQDMCRCEHAGTCGALEHVQNAVGRGFAVLGVVVLNVPYDI